MSATHTEEVQASFVTFGRPAQSQFFSKEQSEPLDDGHTESPVGFAYAFEEAFARTLDQHGITWQYKPRTFAVEWDNEGNFVDSFTPDFYLPLLDLYVELIGPDRSEAAAKEKKARLLRQQEPGLQIELVRAAGSSLILRIFLRRLYWYLTAIDSKFGRRSGHCPVCHSQIGIDMYQAAEYCTDSFEVPGIEVTPPNAGEEKWQRTE
jgi:hypothetical protein